VPRKSYQNGLPIKPRVCCMQYYVNYNTIAIGWAIIWATVYRTGLPWNGHRLNQWASTQSVGIDPISKTRPLISGHRPNTCKDLTLGSTPEGDTKQKATQRGDIDYFSPSRTTDYAVIVMAIDIPSSDAHFNFRPIVG